MVNVDVYSVVSLQPCYGPVPHHCPSQLPLTALISVITWGSAVTYITAIQVSISAGSTEVNLCYNHCYGIILLS